MLRPETQAAAKRARLLIEEAETLGEPPDDPLLLFSVLYTFWVASYVAFDGDAMRTSGGAIPDARRGAEGDCPSHDRASPHGHFLDVYGIHHGSDATL